MSSRKIKIDRQLYDQAVACARKAGYSSVDEFIRHVLEKEVERLDREDPDEEAIRQRLKGLGYLE
jgi:hypothetical protein